MFCRFCDKTFSTTSNRNRHEQKAHAASNPAQPSTNATGSNAVPPKEPKVDGNKYNGDLTPYLQCIRKYVSNRRPPAKKTEYSDRSFGTSDMNEDRSSHDSKDRSDMDEGGSDDRSSYDSKHRDYRTSDSYDTDRNTDRSTGNSFQSDDSSMKFTSDESGSEEQAASAENEQKIWRILLKRTYTTMELPNISIEHLLRTNDVLQSIKKQLWRECSDIKEMTEILNHSPTLKELKRKHDEKIREGWSAKVAATLVWWESDRINNIVKCSAPILEKNLHSRFGQQESPNSSNQSVDDSPSSEEHDQQESPSEGESDDDDGIWILLLERVYVTLELPNLETNDLLKSGNVKRLIKRQLWKECETVMKLSDRLETCQIFEDLRRNHAKKLLEGWNTEKATLLTWCESELLDDIITKNAKILENCLRSRFGVLRHH